METRRNVRQMKNENNENLQETKERSHAGISKTTGLQRDKRVPLGSLSNSRYPIQTRNKVCVRV